MVETSKIDSQSPTNTNSPTYPPRPAATGGRQRLIASCLTCRRRKVKCDHGHPICGACTRGNHVCTYATDQVLGQNGSHRISKPTTSPVGKGSRGLDVQARLDRLELLLEKAAGGHQNLPRTPGRNGNMESENRETDSGLTPSSNSQSSHCAEMSSDNADGTLLLEEGQSQFVSSLHWALLADEIQDIKALLGDKSDDEREVPTQNNMVALLSLGRANIGTTLQSLVPETQAMQDTLLNLYFTNVDPMVRVTHNPTFLRKFPYHVREMQPLAFAVFYSAINSLTPSAVEEKFGESKTALLARYELGVEISLGRENYLTTSSLEILQGFVIWLTCITREDDMGKAWALLGLAIRIALNQGLHRDPSLFPAGSMDAVTIELRRRLWHQICHLEYRAAECKGQEPSITDDDFTTMLPRNIDDDELIEGASPGPSAYDEQRFTSISFQLIRFVGMRALRRIVQSTYRLERRMLECGLHGTTGPDAVRELTNIYEQIKLMVDEMHEENLRKILKYADPTVAMERLCLGLGSVLEWRCYLVFWLRMPRAYRDVVFSVDIRRSIFDKSVNCLETLNVASVDVDAARFQWHIGGHSAFQAIMHILSELRNSSFDVPDRQRALRALHMTRVLKETNNTKAWTVVKSMIDKVVSEQSNLGANSQSSSSFEIPPTTLAPSSADTQYFPYVNEITAYPLQQRVVNSNSDSRQILASTPPPPLIQAQPVQTPFNWDDINLNNIIGIGDDQPYQEMPEFDFGFWGDPVTFNDTMAYPSDADVSYFPPQGF